MVQRVTFAADDRYERSALWESNGTAAGTKEIGVLSATGGAFTFSEFADIGGSVMFQYSTPQKNGLLVTNGTGIKALSVPGFESLGTQIVAVGREAYFGATELIDGRAYYNLWE